LKQFYLFLSFVSHWQHPAASRQVLPQEQAALPLTPRQAT
jgi:hypothetical protein